MEKNLIKYSVLIKNPFSFCFQVNGKSDPLRVIREI